jgi:hypothetical protein
LSVLRTLTSGRSIFLVQDLANPLVRQRYRQRVPAPDQGHLNACLAAGRRRGGGGIDDGDSGPFGQGRSALQYDDPLGDSPWKFHVAILGQPRRRIKAVDWRTSPAGASAYPPYPFSHALARSTARVQFARSSFAFAASIFGSNRFSIFRWAAISAGDFQ